MNKKKYSIFATNLFNIGNFWNNKLFHLHFWCHFFSSSTCWENMLPNLVTFFWHLVLGWGQLSCYQIFTYHAYMDNSKFSFNLTFAEFNCWLLLKESLLRFLGSILIMQNKHLKKKKSAPETLHYYRLHYS